MTVRLMDFIVTFEWVADSFWRTISAAIKMALFNPIRMVADNLEIDIKKQS